MSTTDLNLALRIKADLEQGRQELAALGSDLQGVEQDAGQAGAALDGLSVKIDGAGQQAVDAAAQVNGAGAAIDQMAVDASQAEAALDGLSVKIDGAGQQAVDATSQVNGAGTALDKLGADAAAAGAGMDQAAAASQRTAAAGAAMVAALQEQVALFGKSQEEVLRYRAAQLGAADAVEPLLQQLSALRTEQQQAAAAAQAEEQAQREAAAAKQAAASQQQAFIAGLREQAELQGKSRLEVLEYRAAQLGVTGEAAGYIARLRETADVQGIAGMTAGQYSQAMRMLPMQMTDVVTSLASGMPVWMVAIQQGGQIRDSFGGIGNAGRAVLGMLNPLTIGIAAAAAAGIGLIAAWQQGAAEAEAYQQALILTGNAAGTNADQLGLMAQRIDAVTGSQRQAAAALAEVAGTGKFTATQIEAIGTAAVAMENATGRAISDTVAEFERLAQEPAAASAKLNEQYNYLTAAVYQQIKALEDQGDTQAAAQLATDTYAAAMKDRAAEIEANLGTLERAWKSVGEGAAWAWDRMLDIGRPAALETQLQAAMDELENAQRMMNQRYADSLDEQRLAEAERRVEYLRGQIGAEAEKALEDQQNAIRERAGIAAAKDLGAALKANRTEAASLAEQLKKIDEQVEAARAAGVEFSTADVERLKQAAQDKARAEFDRLSVNAMDKKAKLEQEIAEIRKVGLRTGATEAEIEKTIADARDRYTESLKKPKKEKAFSDDAGTKMLQQLREQQAALAAQVDSTDKLTNSEQQLQKWVQLIGDLKEKKILTADQKSLLANQESITALLNQNAALEEQIQKRKLAQQNAKDNAGLEAEYLRLMNQSGDAASIEVAARFAQMQEQFKRNANDAGLEWIEKLIPLEQAKARLADVQQQMDKILAEQQRQEQSVNVQQDAGLLTELDARRQILDIHKQTAAELEKMRPLLAEMARQPGAVGQSARAALQGLDNQAVRLRATTSLLAETLRTGIEQGLARALQGLADGTMTVRDAVRSLAQSVLQSMAQLAAQQLAQQATQGFAGMFSGITQAAPQAVQAITTVQTAQQAATTAMTASSAAAATTTAATQAGAAATTAASWTPAAIAASIGSFGGAAAIGLAAVMAALAFQAFADGGHVTGPGTATSDSIPAWLSNGEFVSRAAVVAQPGALGFLHDFNARGMSALDDWAGAVRHSTGGLAGIPAPAMPGPGRVAGRLAEPAKAFSTTVQNRQTFNLIDSPERIASALNTPAGHEAITVMLSNDPAKFRSILGV